MLIKFILVAFLAIKINNVESSKILGLFWTPSKSHYIAGVPLLKALAKKGHQVYMLSSFTEDVDIPTYKQELLTGIVGTWDSNINPNLTFLDKILNLKPTLEQNMQDFWKNEPIKNLIKTKPKYDVVIVLSFFNDFLYAIPNHLNVPTIIFSSVGSNYINNKYVANPNLPYSANSLFDTPDNGFFARFAAVSINMFLYIMEKCVLHPIQYSITKENLPDTPSMEDLVKIPSLVLVNSHHSIEKPRPYVPNMIQIGGYHTTEIKKLPENLQKYLDEASKGVILFSLGTNIKIKTFFKPEQLDAIMEVFKQLAPIKVLFKSEIEIPNAPKNVLVSKWLPQNDLLAHPNIKLFVSHGGLGGTTESVYHGVPMLGLPFFADQNVNVRFVIDAGFGLKLNFQEINKDNFNETIRELLNDPKYSINAKKRSSLFRNQMIKPMDKAIWWVEHIIEHKGGEHLKNLGMDLKWYQLYLFDVMLVYLFIITITISIIYFVIKRILKTIISSCFNTERKKDKKKIN